MAQAQVWVPKSRRTRHDRLPVAAAGPDPGSGHPRCRGDHHAGRTVAVCCCHLHLRVPARTGAPRPVDPVCSAPSVGFEVVARPIPSGGIAGENPAGLPQIPLATAPRWPYTTGPHLIEAGAGLFAFPGPVHMPYEWVSGEAKP